MLVALQKIKNKVFKKEKLRIIIVLIALLVLFCLILNVYWIFMH